MSERQKELQEFKKNWQGKPKSQVIEEIASYSHETRRLPDPYTFVISGSGELYSPEAKCSVKSVVKRDTRIGELEYLALCDVESWAKGRDSGVIVWISPPEGEIYPTSKLIISEIERNECKKTLFNRAIILDLNAQDCLRLARNLGRFQFTSAEDVRRNPVPIETKGIHWTYILGEFINIPEIWEMVRRGDDKKAKQETLVASKEIYSALVHTSTDVANIFGAYSTSCPPILRRPLTSFDYIFKSSLLLSLDRYFCKKCPACNTQINCVVRPGERCPVEWCNTKRECA